VWHTVLQRVGPGGGPGGHGGIIIETIPAQHVEHFVSSNSQERCSHALYISWIHTSIPDQKFSFSNNFIGPLFLIEIGAKRMSDCVRCNFVTISIQILDLGVVSPLMGHIKCRLHWATIGVEASTEELFIERLVEIIDSIIKSEHDKLGNLVSREAARDILPSTVAVRNLAECWVAMTRFKLSLGPVGTMGGRGQHEHGPYRDKCPQTHLL